MTRRRTGWSKSKFESSEDSALLNIVSRLGPTDWKQISAHIPGRTARQCRERWTNYIDPNLVITDWTDAEDRILLQGFMEFGPKWFAIAMRLPGRSRNSVKNRYTTLQRRMADDPRPRLANHPKQGTEQAAVEDPHKAPDPFSFLENPEDGLMDWDEFDAYKKF
jgi:hypothetical protein